MKFVCAMFNTMQSLYVSIIYVCCVSVVFGNQAYVYKVKNTWQTGFQGSFKFTPSRSIKGWNVTFRYTQPILARFECWGGNVISTIVFNSGQEFVVQHPGYKPNLKAGELYEIGFVGYYKEGVADPKPPPVIIKLQGRTVYLSPDPERATPQTVLTTTNLMYPVTNLSRIPTTTSPPDVFNPLAIDVSVLPKNTSTVADNNTHGNNNRTKNNNDQQHYAINEQNNATQGTQQQSNNYIGGIEGSGRKPEPSLTNTTQELTGTTPMRFYNGTSKYDYAVVLHKSILFYEAQRSGKLPPNNRVSWRGDSALQDRGRNDEDLTGGYYDAGDNMKFGFPMASSLTLLAWGVIEYWDAYEATGELQHALDSLRWGADYIMKAHVSPFELYAQVGDASQDHRTWRKPERMHSRRTPFRITKQRPGSDLAGESSAALAAISLAFRRTSGAEQYVRKLLEHANNLLVFANEYRRPYHLWIPEVVDYYKSTGYIDEIIWATAWMYRATGNKTLLEFAQSKYINWLLFTIPKNLMFSWDEKRPGLQMLMAQIDPSLKQKYDSDVKAYCSTLRTSGTKYTGKGLLFLSEWSPLRYAANAAFVCLMAADHGIDTAVNKAWATKQIHYMLGDGGRSYVVGFGKNYPKRPHHRASSCPALPLGCGFGFATSSKPNPFILEGALVGGPTFHDQYEDERMDFKQSTVALDHNAGFQGAIAALQYRKMFPQHNISRSHELWYVNSLTEDPVTTTDVDGSSYEPWYVNITTDSSVTTADVVDRSHEPWYVNTVTGNTEDFVATTDTGDRSHEPWHVNAATDDSFTTADVVDRSHEPWFMNTATDIPVTSIHLGDVSHEPWLVNTVKKIPVTSIDVGDRLHKPWHMSTVTADPTAPKDVGGRLHELWYVNTVTVDPVSTTDGGGSGSGRNVPNLTTVLFSLLATTLSSKTLML